MELKLKMLFLVGDIICWKSSGRSCRRKRDKAFVRNQV